MNEIVRHEEVMKLDRLLTAIASEPVPNPASTWPALAAGLSERPVPLTTRVLDWLRRPLAIAVATSALGTGAAYAAGFEPHKGVATVLGKVTRVIVSDGEAATATNDTEPHDQGTEGVAARIDGGRVADDPAREAEARDGRATSEQGSYDEGSTTDEERSALVGSDSSYDRDGSDDTGSDDTSNNSGSGSTSSGSGSDGDDSDSDSDDGDDDSGSGSDDDSDSDDDDDDDNSGSGSDDDADDDDEDNSGSGSSNRGSDSVDEDGSDSDDDSSGSDGDDLESDNSGSGSNDFEDDD